ncbi:MAG: glycosyltransferase family 4 protein [Microbacteriaceae bacterium]|nr:glycosyltransferase family 4 protein [Microbacteriaceae bacterium]
MKISIVSRIYKPEESAASTGLSVLANSLALRGHEVTVVTAKAPKKYPEFQQKNVKTRRFPVFRDKEGYVRGYLSYLSFDVPLFFRLLFSKRADVYFVEPPPTTGFVVRIVCILLRRPYVYNGADIWSDAASQVTNSSLVLKILRVIEKFAFEGASHIVAVSEGLLERLVAFGVTKPVTVVGFAADTDTFGYLPAQPLTAYKPVFVYPGSFSEWHGAAIFINAFKKVREKFENAELHFYGNGEDRKIFEGLINKGRLSGIFLHYPIPASDLNIILNKATLSLASLKPNQGYDYAFTTKIYSSLAAGCPVLFTGVGPTVEFIENANKVFEIGAAVPYIEEVVVNEMLRYASNPLESNAREQISKWTKDRHSFSTIATKISLILEDVATNRRKLLGR